MACAAAAVASARPGADDGVVSWLALKTVARPIREVYLNPRQTKVILRAAAPKFKLNN
jgi:hypothetical protein